MNSEEGATSKDAWLKQLEAEGIKKKSVRPVKEKAEVTVEVPARLLWVTSAFVALSRTRLVVETGPQPMTFSDILAYCELMQIIDEEDRRDLVYFLTELDIIYLRHSHAKIEQGREKAEREARQKADRERRKR